MHGAKDISVVSHGHGRHAHFFHTLAKFFDVAGAIQQGVIGMQVQVDELGHRPQFHSTLRVILTGKALAQTESYPQSRVSLNREEDAGKGEVATACKTQASPQASRT